MNIPEFISAGDDWNEKNAQQKTDALGALVQRLGNGYETAHAALLDRVADIAVTEHEQKVSLRALDVIAVIVQQLNEPVNEDTAQKVRTLVIESTSPLFTKEALAVYTLIVEQRCKSWPARAKEIPAEPKPLLRVVHIKDLAQSVEEPSRNEKPLLSRAVTLPMLTNSSN